MKSHILIRSAVCLVVLLASWSCRNNWDASIRPADLPISVQEAQNWYNTSRNTYAGVSAGQLTDRIPIWQYARTDQLANGTLIVVVPLMYGTSAPISIAQGTTFEKKKNTPYLPSLNKKDRRIQKKLIIAKDGQDSYRSCVIVVTPTEGDRQKNTSVKKSTFNGSVMVFDESETHFLAGWVYKNGKIKQTIQPGSLNSARLASACSAAIYQSVPDWRSRPSQAGGGNQSNGMPDFPQFFVDEYDIGWELAYVMTVDCVEGYPTSGPVQGYDDGDPDTPNQANWLQPISGGGSSSHITDPYDPFTPIPIDEGMPIDLSVVDAFFWEMQHHWPVIAFDEDEIMAIRFNPGIVAGLRNEIYQINRKPDVFKYFSVDIQLNDLTGCIGSVAQRLDLNKLKSHYGRLLYELYVAPGSGNTLRFRQAAPADMPLVLGQPAEGQFLRKDDPNGGLPDVDLIKLNSDLQNSSKEYIASIIVHEMAHSIITYFSGGDLDLFNNVNDRQHISMFNSSVNNLSAMLRELYPTLPTYPVDEATALCIASLQTIFINRFGKVPTNFNQKCIDSYGISIDQAMQIGARYKYGTSGTRCQ